MSKNAILLIRHTSIALGIAAVSFCLVFFLRGAFSYRGGSDACFVTGALELGIAGLLFIGRAGTLDVLAYGVKRLVDQFTHHDDPEYKTAGDYSLAKKEKRKSVRFPYWVYLALAGVFLLLALVFGLLSAPR